MAGPDSVRVVIGAPDGSLTGDGSSVDQAGAVEVLVDRGPRGTSLSTQQLVRSEQYASGLFGTVPR